MKTNPFINPFPFVSGAMAAQVVIDVFTRKYGETTWIALCVALLAAAMWIRGDREDS